MGETVFFIFFITSYGAMALGQIVESEFNMWRQNKQKPLIEYPKRFNLIPIQDRANPNRIAGYNVTTTPMYMHKTKQKEICSDISEIEILGEIQDQDGVLTCVGEGKDIFNELYIDAVKEWELETSGLVKPSAQESAAILNKDTIPFPKGKRK